MNISNKTVLITGGGSGIGYAIAKLLSKKGNKVIIAGRSADKIKKAAAELNVIPLVYDISVDADVDKLVELIKNQYGALSVLINNAGVTNAYSLGEGAGSFEKSQNEFLINYLSPVRLSERLIPVLKNQPEAAIVNVTSNVIYHPLVIMPSYSDTKAALHSHTLALRHTLAKDTAIKVYELQPPLVDTEPAKVLGGETNGLHPDVVAQGLIDGIETDLDEIYIGETSEQRKAFFLDPKAAFEVFNKGL